MAQLGAPVGSLLSSFIFKLFSDDELMDGAWRVPFLISGVLVIVGLLIRLRLEESDEFKKAKEKADDRAPAKIVLKHYPIMLICTFLASAAVSGVYIRNVFALNWATSDLGVAKNVFLTAVIYGALAQLVLTPIGALIADRLGPDRGQLLWCIAYLILAPIPLIMLVATGDPTLVTVGVILSFAGHALYYSSLAGFLSTLFPAGVRFTGISMGYQLAGSLISAGIPALATWATAGGAAWPAALIYGTVIMISIVGVVWGARARSTSDEVPPDTKQAVKQPAVDGAATGG